MADEGSTLPALSLRTTRRTVVRTAAWSVPVVSLAVSSPAFASSADWFMYANAQSYQTPTAWERVVWPEATDDSGTTRIEHVFVSYAGDEQPGATPRAFQLQMELPAWADGLPFAIELSEADAGGPALEFEDLVDETSGTVTQGRITINGALRPGETSQVVNVVVGGQGPVEPFAMVLTWNGNTEVAPVDMVSWAQAEHGRDAPPLLVPQDLAARSFVLEPSLTEATLRLPAVWFPPEAPDPGHPHEVSVQLDIEYFAPFAGPLEGTLSLLGGSVPVRLTQPVRPDGVLDFSTNGQTIRWQGIAPLEVGDSIGAVELSLRGLFEVNGVQVTARFFAGGEEFEQFVLVLGG